MRNLALVFVILGSQSVAVAQARIVPIGNYHAHLANLGAMKVWEPEPVSAVELPTELAQVMSEYERLSKLGDGHAFAALFTDDALVPSGGGWIRGRSAIEESCCSAHRFRPQRYAIEESTAYVVGMDFDEGDHGRSNVGRVILTLRRGSGRAWLISTRLEDEVKPPEAFTAEKLIAALDSAGVRRALVLGVAYWFGAAPSVVTVLGGLSLTEEYAKVREENDWVARQVARYPTRLVAFCSVNPLKPYALEELERCSRRIGLKGIKLHFANSGVDLRKPEDVMQLRRVFQASNERRMPIVAHLRPRREPYGRDDAQIVLRELLPAAPSIPIQIAHLAGWGGYDDATDEALGVFVDAVRSHDPRVSKVYFDLTSVVFRQQPIDQRRRIADWIRQLGLRRVLYGSDMTTEIARNWAEVIEALPLKPEELRIVAGNVTPYLRSP